MTPAWQEELRKEAREAIWQSHCRYCGRQEQKGERCYNDCAQLLDEFEEYITKTLAKQKATAIRIARSTDPHHGMGSNSGAFTKDAIVTKLEKL